MLCYFLYFGCLFSGKKWFFFFACIKREPHELAKLRVWFFLLYKSILWSCLRIHLIFFLLSRSQDTYSVVLLFYVASGNDKMPILPATNHYHLGKQPQLCLGRLKFNFKRRKTTYILRVFPHSTNV